MTYENDFYFGMRHNNKNNGGVFIRIQDILLAENQKPHIVQVKYKGLNGASN